MNCKIIDGKNIANKYYTLLSENVQELRSEYKLIPKLAVVLVGEDPASKIYVQNKLQKAKDLGIAILDIRLPYNILESELVTKINHLNNDHNIHGILVQLPLPNHIQSNRIINLIDPDKDVDGFTIKNIGLLNTWQDCLEPCTPKGALILIKNVMGENLTGYKSVIIGRSMIVGRPLASMLLRENCSVTILHSKSNNLIEESKTADILISATGNPNMVKANWVKDGACVIDVGIIRVNNKLYGDVDFNDVVSVAGFITPVPGGVGPMTVACMLSNTIKATCAQNKIILKNFL